MRQSIAYLGFPAYYVTEEGEVCNDWSGRPVKPSVAIDGQWKVNLKNDNQQFVTVLVARLIAEVYVENPHPRCDTIMFLDGDKSNPRARNLAWRTRPYCNDYYKMFRDSYRNPISAPIVCVEDGLTWFDPKDAAMHYGLTTRAILESVWEDGKIWAWPLYKHFRWLE
jgi:hypothetical protein